MEFKLMLRVTHITSPSLLSLYYKPLSLIHDKCCIWGPHAQSTAKQAKYNCLIL